MSVITHMVLVTPGTSKSEQAVDALNKWSSAHGEGQTFEPLPLCTYDLEQKYGWKIIATPGAEYAAPLGGGEDCARNHHFTGGSKVFCQKIFMCAGNHFPWRALLDAFAGFGWGPYTDEMTILLVNPEGEHRWIGVTGAGRPIAASTAAG